jgi:DNA-binding HxlR family transcriptional regulator
LQDSVGAITPNTLNTRIKEMRAAGLMTHGTSGYTVTTLGADLLKRMNDMQAFATKWVASQSKPAVVKKK